jgi:Heparinase II/III N-terminus/Heparinase II/III-like protein
MFSSFLFYYICFKLGKLKIAFQIPVNVLIKRIIKRIVPAKKYNYHTQELRSSSSNQKINSLINAEQLNVPVINQDVIEHYLKHEYDLLGSSWQTRNSNQKINLLAVHNEFSNSIVELIDNDYQFINWQLDVKTGFEFNVQKSFSDQANLMRNTKGVDIKNVWELGRLQHLPQLALAVKSVEDKETIIKEFKNQCLDFIASNPVGMGAQWACSMDVGIRVANLLVTYDIVKQIDTSRILNDEFDAIFLASIVQHGQFVFNHLEQKEGLSGNHYLFNLTGLLFVCNYLEKNEELITWQQFAESEIEREFEKQFFDDGGNFEGSTTYHCLSTEVMLYATALMLRNGKQLSATYKQQLYKAGKFIKDVLKPNGEMPQFGDNDSGRLFTFCHSELVEESDKKLLNYESLLSGLSGLFKNELESKQSLIEQLSNNSKLEIDQIQNANHQTSVVKQLEFSETTEIPFSSNINISEVEFSHYPDFGISVFKSANFYLTISTISNKKMHHSWGHVHNDKLSFELQVNGIDLVKDSGTYTYSANHQLRNEFRSTAAHHGIIVEGVPEQNNFDKEVYALTYMDREITCKVLEQNENTITLQANYYGVTHIRKFEIFSEKLVITDSCNKPFKVNINQFDKHSPNYGVIQNLK